MYSRGMSWPHKIAVPKGGQPLLRQACEDEELSSHSCDMEQPCSAHTFTHWAKRGA